VSFLKVRAVHKAFGDNAVLRGIDLDVDLHEVVVLIGASGSGKSTILRCINGLEEVDAGSVRVDDLDVTAPDVDLDAVRQRVGIVFQQFNLFPHMSVLDNVTLGPRKVLGTSRAQAQREAQELLGRFGLQEKARDYPDRLSGGQQQRVAIVRALAMRPDLMLFDEVTSALDPLLVGEVLDVIRELKREGMTIVMATHEMEFAREVADRVCFLADGVVLEQGPPAQVFGEPRHERTRAFLARVTARGAGGQG
jgi:polar amino acid transport system ATP-binding protein